MCLVYACTLPLVRMGASGERRYGSNFSPISKKGPFCQVCLSARNGASLKYSSTQSTQYPPGWRTDAPPHPMLVTEVSAEFSGAVRSELAAEGQSHTGTGRQHSF